MWRVEGTDSWDGGIGWGWCCKIGGDGCGRLWKGFPRDMRRWGVHGVSGEVDNQGRVRGDVAVKVIQAGSDVELLEVLQVWLEGRENDICESVSRVLWKKTEGGTLTARDTCYV